MLTLALITGLLFSITSLLELVLHPDQRKQIDSFIEDLVLHAEYTEPEAFKNRITEPGVQVLFFIFVLFYSIIAIATQIILTTAINHFILKKSTSIYFPSYYIAAGLFLTTPIIYKCCQNILPSFFTWIFREKNLKRQRLKAAIPFIGIPILTLAYIFLTIFPSLIIGKKYALSDDMVVEVWLWLNLPLWPVVFLWAIISNGFMIASFPNSRGFKSYFKFFRATLWRFALYSKGPTSATIIVITAIIGIIKVMTNSTL